MGNQTSSTFSCLEDSAVATGSIKKMRAVIYDDYGGANVMKLGTVPVPKPLPTQLLVRVKAASINPIDVKRREGGLKQMQKESFPVTLGYDVSGEVIEVGAQAGDFKVGDQIFARVDQRASDSGTIAEFAVVSGSTAAHKPEQMSHAQAAATPLAALTAYQCLERSGVKEGHKVFITGGAGGVGSFGVQFAKRVFKAGPVITTGSDAKKEVIMSLGADEMINYREQKFEEVVKDADVSLCFTDETERVMRTVKKGGRCATITGIPEPASFARAGMADPGFIVSTFLWLKTRDLLNAATDLGIDYGFEWMKPDGALLQKIGGHIAAGSVTPLVAAEFGLEDFAKAFALSESGRATGKVVIIMPDASSDTSDAGAGAATSGGEAAAPSDAI